MKSASTESNSDNSVVGFQPLSQMSTPVFPNTYLRIVLQSITCAKIRFWKLFSPEQETLFFNEWSKKASLTEILLVFYIDKTKTWTDTWKRREKMLNLIYLPLSFKTGCFVYV